jgi:hypothetical protein
VCSDDSVMGKINDTARRLLAALNHLLALGDIEPNPDPALREQGLYRLTRQGLTRVRELLRR